MITVTKTPQAAPKESSSFIRSLTSQKAHAKKQMGQEPSTNLRRNFDLSQISMLPSQGHRIQPKLKINTPNDKYEQEADSIADKVVDGLSNLTSSSPGIQKKCKTCQEETDIQRKEIEDVNSLTVSPDSALEEESIQLKPNGSRNILNTSSIQDTLIRDNSQGNSLPEGIKGLMESSFQRDFSKVKIHSDTTAAQMSRGLGAKAFTNKSNIYFGEGQFKPNTKEGLKLIAHELTHTIQQESASGSKPDIQKSEADTLRLCPPYWRWQTPRDVETYNCAGLSNRTYDKKSIVGTSQALSAGRQANNCSEGEVKHWLWVYDLHGEDHMGRRGGSSPDFHTVAGVSGPNGADPTDVYSKNGNRPVYGPGSGPSFKPLPKEQDRYNNRNERLKYDPQGNPRYKVRTNMREFKFCLPCSHP